MLLAVGIGNSVTTPAVVICPILLRFSVNQRLPSGPAAIPKGLAAAGGNGELRDDAGGGDPPDLVAVDLGEPEVAVRAGGDA